MNFIKSSKILFNFTVFLLLTGLPGGSLFAANRDFIRLSAEQNFILLDRFERRQPPNISQQFIDRPLEIIDRHHLLGDGFTRVVKVRWLVREYFLQGPADFKTLSGEAPADTIVVTAINSKLPTGSRWIRVFTSNRDWYLQSIETENSGHWIHPLQRTDYEKWQESKTKITAGEEWKDWLQLEMQSTNDKIRMVFDALSQASGIEMSAPFWSMIGLENRALLVWHSGFPVDQFNSSRAIFLQHIRQLLPENSFMITEQSGQIDIRRRL